MTYGYKRYGRNRYGKRYKKRYYKRKFGFGKPAYKGKYVTNRSQHPEYKFIDKVTAQDDAIDDSGVIYSLCEDIVKGTGASQRIGEQVVLRSLQYKFLCSANPEALGPSPIRLIVGIDTQSNGAVPTSSLLLQDNTAPITSPLKMGIAERFKILKDKVYTPDSDDPTAWIKGYIKLNHVVKYISANAIPQKNELFIYLFSNRDETEGYPPQENHYIRVRFTDE